MSNPIILPVVGQITQYFDDPRFRGSYSKFLVPAPGGLKVPMKGHNGIDIACQYVPFYMPITGTVEFVGNDAGGYGLYIKVRNERQHVLLAHLSKVYVQVGQNVLQGQAGGITGNSGNSTGPHIHFGYWEDPRDIYNGFGGYVDPINFLGNQVAPIRRQLPMTDEEKRLELRRTIEDGYVIVPSISENPYGLLKTASDVDGDIEYHLSQDRVWRDSEGKEGLIIFDSLRNIRVDARTKRNQEAADKLDALRRENQTLKDKLAQAERSLYEKPTDVIPHANSDSSTPPTDAGEVSSNPGSGDQATPTNGTPAGNVDSPSDVPDSSTDRAARNFFVYVYQQIKSYFGGSK